MQCLKCKIEKETREFQENEFLTRGYVDNCYECESIYYDYAMIQNKRNETRVLNAEKEKAIVNQRQNNYNAKNRALVNERERLKYSKNKDAICKRRKEQRDANKVPKVIDPKEFTYRDVINKYKQDRLNT
jgi:hypothetical protein